MDSYCIHLKSWSNLIKFLKSGVVHLDLKPANISITVEGLTLADATLSGSIKNWKGEVYNILFSASIAFHYYITSVTPPIHHTLHVQPTIHTIAQWFDLGAHGVALCGSER